MSPQETVRYSLIVCTYNQSKSLALMLGYLATQKIDNPAQIEAILVDNNSSDATREVYESYREKIPFACRYVFEGRQGLSVARNRGVAEARGEILIFTDDDARLPEQWLQSLMNCYAARDADCVYGKIIIDWDKGKPYWYSDRYRSMFVGVDYGDQILAVKDFNHEFYGKNFSLKKSILLAFGGFDESLGRKGDRLFIGEETKIYRNLISNGYKVFYDPAIYLFHMLKDYEYTEEHFTKHYRDATISEYLMLRSAQGKTLFGRPVYALKKVLVFMGRMPLLSLQLLLKPSRQKYFQLRLDWKKHWQLLCLWLRNADTSG